MCKKSFKAGLAGVAVIVGAVVLAGCPDGGKGGNQVSQESTVKIGAILPQTGPGGVFAEYIEDGTNLAVEEINKDSKLPIQVLYEDSKNQPKEGVTVYNKLVAGEKPPIIMVALSSVASAVRPLAESTDSNQIYIAVAVPNVTDGKHTFRVYPEANGMAGVMARYNADTLKAKTTAVIYINDDFGQASLDAYRKQFETRGGKVVFQESYEPRQPDFRSQIAKLKAVSPAPDVIYISGYGPSYGAIIKQLKELGVKSKLTADMTLGLPATLKQVGNSVEGSYFVDGKMSPEFATKFRQKYSKEPSSYAGYAYDIIRILHSIAEKQGSLTNENVRQGLLSIKNYAGVMGNVTIQPNGDSNLEFVVKQVKGGKPAVVSG